MDNVGAHTDPQRLLAVPGSQSADAQITKLSEGYAAWSEELVASSTSALDETIGSAAFAQLYASVAKAQGDTEISAVGHGRRIVGDTGNVLHGRIATKEHIQGVIRSAQVIAPRNIVFAPDHRLFVPCCQKRVITGDRLSLKEDAAQILDRISKSLRQNVWQARSEETLLDGRCLQVLRYCQSCCHSLQELSSQCVHG